MTTIHIDSAFAKPVSPNRAEAALPHEDDSRDFDFLFGRWIVHNRRLRERLEGCTVWDEYEGTLVARPIWGGKANLDEYEAEGPAGRTQALTLRLFDPRSRQWRIHWGVKATGMLDNPMIGSFQNGRGEFYDQELFKGRSIFSRFIWTVPSPATCRWEQAFSADGGTTWETNWVMEFRRPHEVQTFSPVLELRSYTMKPGRRDDLITLFEEHFIEGQERCGMHVVGHFIDRNDPDRFTWMRGFASMEVRRKALESFYDGPLWATHRAAANDTMVDSHNVLLLRPARPGSGLMLYPSLRDASVAAGSPHDVVVATICSFDAPAEESFIDFFEDSVAPILRETGARLEGELVTEASGNTFPRHPVREGENVFVSVTSFADSGAYAAHRDRLSNDRRWTGGLLPALESWLAKPVEVLELTPARRSLLRHHAER